MNLSSITFIVLFLIVPWGVIALDFFAWGGHLMLDILMLTLFATGVVLGIGMAEDST